MPDLTYEKQYGLDDGKIICGVDEVGRGPLAGPVVAAALILPREGLPSDIESQIRDSKQLSPKKRAFLFPALTRFCRYAIAEANVAEIDELNILHASMLAMQRAVAGLSARQNGRAAFHGGAIVSAGMEPRATMTPDIALIDGNRAPKLPCPAIPIVKGDSKSLSIAAASIVAKVFRDSLMKKLAEEYPGYGWEKNAGYGTAEHLEALQRLGPTKWHRISFAPVAELKRAS